MTGKKRIAVVGGGASGCALVWSLMRAPTDELVEVTLFHDEDEVGGHSRTIPVFFDGAGKGHVATAASPAPAGAKVYPVDIGVQFVCKTLYPNLYQQLELAEMRGSVGLTEHPALRLSGSFSPTLNWGNFPAYQSGPRFEQCYDAAARQHAAEFQHDVRWGPFTPLDGITFATKVEDYLRAKNLPWSSSFFRYLLIPYLCIINGYGTADLLETTFEDLFPIFTKLPAIQDKGPYGSFTEPGTGWDRFTDGATSWCLAMARYASGKGATIELGRTVLAVYPTADRRQAVIEHASSADIERARIDPSHSIARRTETFDEVVLTTDMTTNRALLDNPRNGYYAVQKDYIAADKFALIPGICFIHQDDECLSPHLRDKKEDGQFVGAYSWGPAPGNAYDLPYDLSTTFQTYLMKNILGTPVDCHVSMYAEASGAKLPAPDKTIHVKTWRHGRWVASFFDKAKKELHRIQGLGHVWFAGNNTTVDSEEGALVSALIIANRIVPQSVYPFELASEAYFFYQYFQNVMFPVPSFPWRLGRAAAEADEQLKHIFEGKAL
jgi:hypothetical protein